MRFEIMRSWLKAFDEADYLTKARARLLFKFEIIFLPLLILVHIAVALVTPEALIRALRVTPLLFIGLSVSLYFLKKGRYDLAANFFVGAAAVSIASGLVLEGLYTPKISYNTFINFTYTVFAFGVLFCNRRSISILYTIMILADAATFFIARSKADSIFMEGIKLAFIDSFMSLTLIYILAIFTLRIFERSNDITREESEKSHKQNEFIKSELRSSTETILSSASGMTSSIASFADNSQNQAASVEEVSASIEEITAGIDSVAANAAEQNRSLKSLFSTMNSLSDLIKEMAARMKETMEVIGQVSGSARSGEQSLTVMNDSMANIGKSSGEMRGIIQIINDISDRINLLSLNAAIEAARAGDAGRGFAVVADEISKLADATASSIKDIGRLIQTNESEIENGTRNVASVVETINAIIHGIETISRMNSIISGNINRQTEENATINANAESVRAKSEEILNAMNEQKNALGEILQSVANINELTQHNSARVEDMAESSNRLSEMVKNLNQSITEYGG
jgi:methyl-accepting chemotaxis protein